MSAIDNPDENETITVEINFPYFKQGDDFNWCQGNLEQFIVLHQNVVQHAQNILNMIPEHMRQYVKGDGNTHFCTLTGPKVIMDKLVANDLARHIDYDE